MATRWLIYKKQQILFHSEGPTVVFPSENEIHPLQPNLSCIHSVGEMRGDIYYAAYLTGDDAGFGTYAFQDVRSLFLILDLELFLFYGKAWQITNWLRTTQFCGVCGAPTIDKGDERARICPHCAQIYYPRISPAVITAVVRDDRILLARSLNVPNNMFSILAGFVEPGETLEDCVHREIQEEVGLRVKNLKYFGSQPWSFPDSLMIGFTAEYASGEITIDNKEIIEAGWYTRETFPANIPISKSLAGMIIDWYRLNKS
jgi:NAD+ diphosphatase